jgi:hypothetical protein
MTPERIAKLVSRWVRLYTHGLQPPVRERRVGEIEADLHDHIAQERAAGTGDRRIAYEIASRMLRGLAADLAWRRTLEKPIKKKSPAFRSAARIVIGVALILSLPAVAMLFTDQVVWSRADFVVAGALLGVIGVAVELTVKRAGNLAVAVAIGVLGIAAGVLGEADDAPGLVLLGLVLVASGCALGLQRKRPRHSARPRSGYQR